MEGEDEGERWGGGGGREWGRGGAEGGWVRVGTMLGEVGREAGRKLVKQAGRQEDRGRLGEAGRKVGRKLVK